MLRVGMDISQIAHLGGVVTYTQNLTRELSKIKELEMVYFYSSLRKPYSGKLKNVKRYRLPPTFFEMLFNRWRNVPIEKFLGPLDIFHSSDWTQPPAKAKKVTTYHDVVALKYPRWSHPKIVAVHKRRLKIVEKEIDIVIAVSQSTKRDLMEVSNIPEEKIIVIYEAPTSDFKPQAKVKIEKFRKKYGLPEAYILAIGGIGERRNLKAVKEAAKDYNLVISGQTIPWLSIDELELLYSGATVLLYPSLYEGFGLPIVDAFACGIPVITSNVSSMPEVGGAAAIYVDPLNTTEMKRKLEILMEDKDLRKEFVKKGFEQVKKFSWEKTAQQTAEVYRRLVG
ncbi:MAG: Glycosyl transferase, group 1 [Microgenomates group bacterium Gr01-1014_7]|nr:MAG: Glycosyl transferase, group 1 [Microgenomates group bacterium Gr01-1014_7]